MKKDASPAKDGPMTFIWRKGIVCALITLVGFKLRSVILAVPGAPDLCRMDVLLMNDAGKNYVSMYVTLRQLGYPGIYQAVAPRPAYFR